MGEITDKLKEKVKDAKDTVVDTTKDVATKKQRIQWLILQRMLPKKQRIQWIHH